MAVKREDIEAIISAAVSASITQLIPIIEPEPSTNGNNSATKPQTFCMQKYRSTEYSTVSDYHYVLLGT